ncbi:MAG: hypothetical protein RIS35_2546 [Pseudomonadota bacterium]|jgi:MFS family permease
MNREPLQGRLAIQVFACFAAAYFLSFAMRAVNAVIAPSLTADFGLTNAQLGSLSAAYFFGFSLLQLPLGVWLDRFGSRRVHATLLLIAAAGCAVFATASDVTGLWVGRALIGAGVAGALMAALKGYRFWYAPERQYQLTAWMLVAGTAGVLSTTVPVQLALPAIGWRGVFWLTMALLLAASVAIFTLVPRDEERATAATRAAAPPGSAFGGYRAVFRDAYFWRFAVCGVFAQSTFMALQTLWAGPWFVRVLGMTPAESAQSLLVFNLTLMLGFFGFGWLQPRLQRRGFGFVGIGAFGLTTMILLQAAIALVDGPSAWWLWPVMAVLSTFQAPMQTHVSLSFPAALTGRAFTAYNLVVFLATFVNQWLFGAVVDVFTRGGSEVSSAFRNTLLVFLVPQVVALAVLVFSKARPTTHA